MKKIRIIILLLISVLFTSCIGVPGYVRDDGTITPPYSKKIIIESLSGTLTIVSVESSKGYTNINPIKSDPLTTQKKKTEFLSETDKTYYNVEGNHSIVFAFRTIDKEAKFTITYKNETTEYTIHNSDLSDKLIYIENY